MTFSIGQLAEQVVEDVKQNALLKVAQHEIVKEASARPHHKTELGKLLYKIAEQIRTEDDVTIGDVKAFLDGINHAG